MNLGQKLALLFISLVKGTPIDLAHVNAEDIGIVATWSARRWGSAIEKVSAQPGVVKRAMRQRQDELKSAIVARARELGCVDLVSKWEQEHGQKAA